MKLSVKNLQSRRAGRAGRTSAFSLAESMVGVALVVFFVIATYTGILAGYQTIQLTREDLRATQILVEKLEAVRLNTWDELQTNVPSTLEPDYLFPSGTNTGQGSTLYTGTVAISSDYTGLGITNGPLLESYAANMRLVTITLNWTNGLDFSSGNSTPIRRTRSMSTYVSRNGLQSYIQKY